MKSLKNEFHLYLSFICQYRVKIDLLLAGSHLGSMLGIVPLSIFAVKLEKWMNLCLLINYNYFAHSIFVDINSFTLVSRQYSLSSCGTCIHFSHQNSAHNNSLTASVLKTFLWVVRKIHPMPITYFLHEIDVSINH